MRHFSNALALLAVSGASLALAGCGNHGPNSYLMPKDALAAKLTGAERDYNLGGKDDRSVRAISRSGDDINVKVSYSNGSVAAMNCKVVIEAIDEEWTRATPSCPKTGDADKVLQAEIMEMQVDEWVLAVLYDREVDTAMVLKRTSAVVIDNLGEVTQQAAKEIEEAAAASETYADAGGWDESGEGDWGN